MRDALTLLLPLQLVHFRAVLYREAAQRSAKTFELLSLAAGIMVNAETSWIDAKTKRYFSILSTADS